MSVMVTAIPSLARAVAMPLPMPRAAPVTMPTLPSRTPMSSPREAAGAGFRQSSMQTDSQRTSAPLVVRCRSEGPDDGGKILDEQLVEGFELLVAFVGLEVAAASREVVDVVLGHRTAADDLVDRRADPLGDRSEAGLVEVEEPDA